MKHVYFAQQFDELSAKNKLNTILNDLTHDDILMLMETEEEVDSLV